MLRKLLENRVAAVLEERGYSDLILAGLEAVVAGSAGNVASTGALEVAAGIWGRTLAAATVAGSEALTPALRNMIGRCLIREGEVAFVIGVVDGKPYLRPVAHFEVQEGWRYRCEVVEPPGRSTSRLYPREQVIHLTWTVHPREPWRGISPLGQAHLLGKLAAGIETKLDEELKAPTAHILPVPFDGGSPQADRLREDVGSAKGAAILLEGTSGSVEGDHRGTQGDWQDRRMGPMIPTELRVFMGDVGAAVAQACGIPNSLVATGNVDGTEVREAYRRFVMASVEPVAAIIAAECSEKLETEVSFDFTGLWAHDLAGRAAAYAKLTGGGMPDADARRLVGFGG